MGFISMTKPCKLVEKAIRRLNASWNSVKKRAKAGSLSHDCRPSWPIAHCVHVIARDSIGLEKGLFESVRVGVQHSQVVEALSFRRWIEGSIPDKVTFFF